MKMKARFLKIPETYPLRLNVLWPHLSKPEECTLPIDNHVNCFHTGVEENGKVVSIATFYEEKHPKLDGNIQYRLRAMASDQSVAGKGYGRFSIAFAEDELRKRKAEILWCDARKSALGFYEKIGFKITGDYYQVRNIGPHKLAYKTLRGQ